MTLFNILEKHQLHHPDKMAYSFMDENDEHVERTFGELYQRVITLASLLQQMTQPGERIMLMFQPSLDFIEAIIACFAAGVVAVPIQPLQNKRVITRIQNIKQDAGANIILTNQRSRTAILRIVPDAAALLDDAIWIESDFVNHGNNSTLFTARPETANDIAFLQYTSGSTGHPKGAIVTNANLLHNLATIKTGFDHDENNVLVGWLPLYHDMGLVGNVFQPLYLGSSAILFAPMTFLKSPIKWLSTISKFKGQTSGAPNFAYELCVSRITDKDMEGIDLSCWKVAYNGSEPIKAHVVDAFSEKFKPYGFKPEAFFPCYGMAENTLFISGSQIDGPVIKLPVDPQKLVQNQIVEQLDSDRILVGCGQVVGDQQVIIVDPQSHQQLADNQVGELWLQGDSVTSGYWNLPELTEQAFNAQTAACDGPWFRTGDLGFCRNNELFITGRIKDLLIIRGQNHYPTDIESTICLEQPCLREGGVAVFTVDQADHGGSVVVAELNRRYVSMFDQTLRDTIVADARKDVSDIHGLRLYDLVVIKPFTLATTTSGKIRRGHCKTLYQSEELSLQPLKQNRIEPNKEIV
jgi:acyl-CoA synthetase (AMP-forming)/AMP-acid ligase II